MQSQSSSYVILDSLVAASGVTPTQFAGTLASDVVTIVKSTVDGKDVLTPRVLEDTGRATMRLALVDPGSADTPTVASTTNTISFTRYHVAYVRADGRNVPGVDVPYGFDGGLTVSVTPGNLSGASFVLVRSQAKDEPPLRALTGGGGAGTISTIAQVTFYGADQAGRAVSVTGSIGVTFSDWGDPK